jgi:hypothetical protein
MTEQLAMVLAEEGKRLSVEALTDQARSDFDRILGDFIAAGGPFSADDLRWALDCSQIPNRARGGLISGALARGLIREVSVKRSTHPATHGKRIGVYQGAA